MKLYGRMLLWFLLANVATAATTIVVGSWLLRQTYSEADARLDGEQAVQIFESQGEEGLQRWLAGKLRQEGIFGVLRDGRGGLIGHPPPLLSQAGVFGVLRAGRGGLAGHPPPPPPGDPSARPELPPMGSAWIVQDGRVDRIEGAPPPPPGDSGPRLDWIMEDGRVDRIEEAPPPPPGDSSPRRGPPLMGSARILQMRSMRQSIEIVSASGNSYRWEVSKRQRPPGIWEQFLDVSVRIGIGVLVLAGVALLAARRIIKPIRNLEIATEAFTAGDFKARASADLSARRDEIGSLAQSFGKMADRIGHLLEGQRRLLRDVSHELRSPLARLTIAAELAREQKKPEHFDRIQQEVQRLEELIAQILTLARMEASQGQRAAIPVNLDELLTQICADTDFEARRRNITVKSELATDCTVDGEPQLLRAAFENVIRNAVRYTAGRTEVSVRLYRQDGKARISVCDRGPGVPPESLAVIFEPFMRVSEARERDSGGYGIGLTIAREALRAHRGGIAASLRSGGGLCIEMELPIRPASPAAGAGE